jgi:hypothetical protein
MKLSALLVGLVAAMSSSPVSANLFDYYYRGTNTVGLFGIGYTAPFAGTEVGVSFGKNGSGMIYANTPLTYGGYVSGWYGADETVLGNVHTYTGFQHGGIQNSSGSFQISGIYENGLLTRVKGSFHIGGQVYPTSSSWAVQAFFWEANAVPEPSSWALMLSGFGAVGASLRGRRTLRRSDRPAAPAAA